MRLDSLIGTAILLAFIAGIGCMIQFFPVVFAWMCVTLMCFGILVLLYTFVDKALHPEDYP